MIGEEREAALASSLKGKERVASNVHKNKLFILRSNFLQSANPCRPHYLGCRR